MTRSPRSAYAGIFLLAGSIILFQIALTRVFSILMWHHFTYMVVSIAMLGFGAAGSFLTARGDSLRHDDPVPSIARSAWAYGLAVVGAFCLATRVEIDTLAIWDEKKNVALLLLFYLIIAVPMFLGGLAIGKVLTRYAERVNGLYFADLIGSAFGGAASIWLLGTVGSTATIAIAGALGAVSGLLFAFGGPWSSRLLAVPPTLIAVGLAIGFLGGAPALGVPALNWDVPFAPGKDIHELGVDLIDQRIPSATAEVQVSVDMKDRAPMIGGNFEPEPMPVDLRYVAQDGTAPTVIYKHGADVGRFPFLRESQAGSAYVAFEARKGREPKVLVIGVGGGVDVMVALAHDAREVTAVEINDAMIRMVTKDYADYLDGLFTPGAHPLADRIHLVKREGRSYMRHSDERYDIIQMAGVDSFTALSTGAYTLAESYLYTVEAVMEFYEHLFDDGYVNYSRFILEHPRKPRETLRLANIAREALERLGVEHPERNIVVFQGRDWASTMIKRGPFRQDEIDALQAVAERRDFRGFVFNPLLDARNDTSPTGTAMREVRGYMLQFGPERLHRPFGLDLDAELTADVLTEAFRGEYERRPEAYAAALRRFSEALPPDQRKRVDQADILALAQDATRFAREGDANFRETQRVFKDLLLASPEERQRFVDAYPFDISPSTDDSPFFFNYYRPELVFSGGDPDAELTENARRYNPDVPVGHRVLFASLAQIALLAVLMILLPLRALRREGLPTPGKWRYLAYFSALGLGFMFIEIALMQKMVIFLGHPTYAVGVVLTSLLGFAGLGSLVAGRLRTIDRRALGLVLLALLAALALVIVGINELLPRLLGLPLAARIAVSVALVAPLALMLGMPFPSGIRVLEKNCPQLLPWGWAINGFLSVLASILCIILSQEIGFTRVLLAAGGLYLVGFLLMVPERREAPAPAPELETPLA